MLLKTWNEVEEWVSTNGFKRVVLRAGEKSGEGERTNDWLFDSRFVSGDSMADKMEHMKWILERCERKVYATGFQNESAGTGGIVAEIRMENTHSQVPAAVGFAPVGTVDESAIIDRVRKEVRAEYEKAELDRERKQFEAEKKQFEAEKNGIMGLVVQYGRPILGALSARKSMVSGVDQPGTTEVDPIARNQGEAAAEDTSTFTDEEADKLFSLMERFKKVEPQYLQLIESVVEMAENGDNTYTMARNILIK